MSTCATIADQFDNTKWGQHFTRDEVEVISKYLRVHTYEPGTTIFHQGERENYMAFIVEGHVDIVKESPDTTERILVTLAPSTHFGEMSFIDDEPRSATATAREHVTLLVLTHESFDSIVSSHPDLGIKMLKNIAKLISQRLRSTTGKLVYFRI